MNSKMFLSEYLHYENTPMQYTENFLVVKMKIFPGKIDIFLIFAQNIVCGYTLEPPHVLEQK